MPFTAFFMIDFHPSATRPTVSERIILSIFVLTIAPALSNSLPPMTLPEGNTLGAVLHTISNNRITSGSSKTRNERFEITA
jgi:hypothetical protein